MEKEPIVKPLDEDIIEGAEGQATNELNPTLVGLRLV